MDTKRIRVALLGAGGFATDAHLPAIAHNTDTLDLVALYSRSLKSAQQLQQAAARFSSLAPTSSHLDLYSDDHPNKHNLATLLARPDLDAVAVCLPIPHQPAVLLECLRAGKHVLSEKPIAPTVHRALELVAEYERDHAPRGVHWLVAEQFPHAAAWEKARQLVRDAKLGRLVGFDADVFIQPSLKAGATNWRRVPDYQGGVLDGGVHFFAALRHVLSGTPTPTDLVAASAHLGSTLVLSYGTPQPSDAEQYTFRDSDAVLIDPLPP
ncbi:uncharacterized protein RHOBADRAFT_41895, partial [Rhodotorula graminis WP1]